MSRRLAIEISKMLAFIVCMLMRALKRAPTRLMPFKPDRFLPVLCRFVVLVAGLRFSHKLSDVSRLRMLRHHRRPTAGHIEKCKAAREIAFAFDADLDAAL